MITGSGITILVSDESRPLVYVDSTNEPWSLFDVKTSAVIWEGFLDCPDTEDES